MSKDNALVVEGQVKETLPQTLFLVSLTTEGFEGHQVKAKISGKMKMYSIKIVPGDWVRIELNPYNLEDGRIVFRSTRPFIS